MKNFILQLENLQIDSVNASYVDKSGSFKNVPLVGDIVNEKYKVIKAEPMPHYLDGGIKPFTVILKLKEIK